MTFTGRPSNLMFHEKRTTGWPVIALAVLVPLGFAAFTHHAWEDFFITFRSSRHLAEGDGLVFNHGERVHTYTSPFGALLPALGLLLAPDHTYIGALWLFRVFSAVLLGGTFYLIWRRLHSLAVGTTGLTVALGLGIFDPKLVDFSINGMETALLAFFAVLWWSELERPDKFRWLPASLALGGLQWTRPDAFILAGALLVPHFIFRPKTRPPTISLRDLAKAAAWGIIIYLPWLAWATWYYGSPIPNTIVAKQAFTAHLSLRNFSLLPLRMILGNSGLDALYTPTYAYIGGWPGFLKPVVHLIAIVVGFAWLFPGASSLRRRMSLTLFLGAIYLSSIILFPWYVPPWTLLSAIFLGVLVDEIVRTKLVQSEAKLVSSARVLVALLLLGQLALFACTAWQMRIHQRLVEDGVRKQIGLWLNAHAKPRDTLFLEPLGYIGYFSQLKTYDFPGLSSPEVVKIVKEGKRSYPEIITALRPTWLVLRPGELTLPGFIGTPVLGDYAVAGHWNAKPQLDQVDFLPGRAWCEQEAEYFVLHRKAATVGRLP